MYVGMILHNNDIGRSKDSILVNIGRCSALKESNIQRTGSTNAKATNEKQRTSDRRVHEDLRQDIMDHL
ncbi:hypothetical protein Tco_1546728 [Tanacetum coccineum]